MDNGQDLCDWLNATRKASITQNLKIHDDVFDISFSNSFTKKVVEELVVDMRDKYL